MVGVIAILTDFGEQDHYGGTMQGVILGIAPGVQLVSVTQQVAAGDIRGGAYQLYASYRYFPAGTVFLCVVDPGVGSARRGLVVAAGGRYFVGPDNGLFSLVLGAEQGWEARELREERFRLPVVSATFHGRDVFAPAAAHVASGVAIAEFGPLVEPQLLAGLQARREGERWLGEVVSVDRFGNAITSLPGAAWDGARLLTTDGGEVRRFVRTFADLAEGEAGVLVGSSGLLEVVVNQGSAAERLGLRAGQAVVLWEEG